MDVLACPEQVRVKDWFGNFGDRLGARILLQWLGSVFAGGRHAQPIAILPNVFEFLGLQAKPELFFFAIVVIAFALMIRNEPLGRFSNLYLGVYFVFAAVVEPWQFLWLAPFAVGIGQLGFRLVSISVFVYYFAFVGSDVSAALTILQSWALWMPLLLGLAWYAVKGRSKTDGLYVRSY